MAKEILLYSSIYPYAAATFINEMEANKDRDIRVRGNCPGGDMFSTYGMIAKFQEHPKTKEIQVDGVAASAFAYMLCFADKVTCLNVSQFLFHRAIYGSREDELIMSDDIRRSLATVNESIRAAMETKCSSEKFKQVTGYGYDQLFSMDDRLDVILNAEQAKECGFVTDIKSLTTSGKTEIKALAYRFGIAAFAKEPVIEDIDTTNKLNYNKMTAAEFKAANPAAYAEILKEGVEKERERIATWQVYKDVDAEAVAKAIEDGSVVNAVVTAEMQLKAVTQAKLGNIAGDNAADIETPEAEAKAKTEAEKESAAFFAEVANNLKNFKI